MPKDDVLYFFLVSLDNRQKQLNKNIKKLKKFFSGKVYLVSDLSLRKKEYFKWKKNCILEYRKFRQFYQFFILKYLKLTNNKVD